MSDPQESPSAGPSSVPPKRRYVRAVGPRLGMVLQVVWVLLALLAVNSVYLGVITFLEWLERDRGVSYQNYFYQIQFLGHLILGIVFLLPFTIFIWIHVKNTWNRKNRKAVWVGYGLLVICIALLVSGFLLIRMDGLEFLQIRNPSVRQSVYWLHVGTPIACVWLYLLHRMAGPRIRWRMGLIWAGVMAIIVPGMILMHKHDPRIWHARAPETGEQYFHPSSARTADGNFIPAQALMDNKYCMECHQDVYDSWFHSAHRFSSFNNPFYLASVKEAREVALKRDGSVQMSRWCAGCHDPVPFFSGAFDDPDFDMVNHPTAHAGITCVACHSITTLAGAHESMVGNANYTIEEPVHYPFATAEPGTLRYFINKQLVKGKPEFHKRTFLKEHHTTAEFCSTCHKVGLPFEVNHYKAFLRGQNHYDTYLLSGVSGVNAKAFYYPSKARLNCAECHMPLKESNDFGARHYGTNNFLAVHDHLFASANTALPHIRGDHDIVQRHVDFLKDSVRVDIFGLKKGGGIDDELVAPLRPMIPEVEPGETYLIETVVRTLTLGHPLTQGTVDSNELWADVTVTGGDGTVIGRSGSTGPHGEVDRWSHFFNVYMLDRHGNRIDRRNAHDIFVPLYNNQIPPGAAAVLHYQLKVPPEEKGPLTVDVKVNYRKFDTLFYNYTFGIEYKAGAPFQLTNDLPIVVLASDRLQIPVRGRGQVEIATEVNIPPWQRWNDYGIGLFLKGDQGSEKGELIQAAHAFEEVEKLGRSEGPINLARVFFKEGRLADAVEALRRAHNSDRFNPPANRWTVAWFNGMVNKQNGYLDEAIREFTSILEDRYPELDERGFNFSRDYEVINELGQTLFERAKMERGNPTRREEFLRQAIRRFQSTLAIDSENVTAHYNLALIHAALNEEADADKHRLLHERYRVDDNARDHAVTTARRRDRAADHAAQAIVIYDLQRE